MKAKTNGQNGKNRNGKSKALKPKGGPNGKSLAKKHKPGHHPNQAKNHFPKGVVQNPDGRPPGIPNLNALLITEAKRFRTKNGKNARGFLMHLLEYASKHPNSKLTERILEKLLADATPKAGPQVNVNSQVTNEHSLHQTILADPAVRDAALAFEERIARSIRNASGPGAGN